MIRPDVYAWRINARRNASAKSTFTIDIWTKDTGARNICVWGFWVEASDIERTYIRVTYIKAIWIRSISVLDSYVKVADTESACIRDTSYTRSIFFKSVYIRSTCI